MYVCICNAVTERQIEEAVKAGARTLADLRVSLGVSAECGSCAQYARECLEQAKKDFTKHERNKRQSETQMEKPG